MMEGSGTLEEQLAAIGIKVPVFKFLPQKINLSQFFTFNLVGGLVPKKNLLILFRPKRCGFYQLLLLKCKKSVTMFCTGPRGGRKSFRPEED